MKKGVEKGLLVVGIILVILILILVLFSGCSLLKSGSSSGFSIANVCSSKCYLNVLLKDRLVTNHPVLDVFETKGPRAYNYNWELNYYWNDSARRNVPINISALNIGKARIPRANVSIEDYGVFEPAYYYNESYWNIYNLNAMDSIQIPSNLWFKVKDGINVSSGTYSLKFKILCPICEEQVYYDYMEICIYRTNPDDDCGEGWWQTY